MKKTSTYERQGRQGRQGEKPKPCYGQSVTVE